VHLICDIGKRENLEIKGSQCFFLFFFFSNQGNLNIRASPVDMLNKEIKIKNIYIILIFSMFMHDKQNIILSFFFYKNIIFTCLVKMLKCYLLQ
jgi:hypothetical protein